jgi:hypothetical protein
MPQRSTAQHNTAHYSTAQHAKSSARAEGVLALVFMNPRAPCTLYHVHVGPLSPCWMAAPCHPDSLPPVTLLAGCSLSPCRYSLSPFQSGLVVSSSLLGALGGSCIALAAGNSLGRRTELLLASALYGGCALLRYLHGMTVKHMPASLQGRDHHLLAHTRVLVGTIRPCTANGRWWKKTCDVACGRLPSHATAVLCCADLQVWPRQAWG